MKSEISRLKAVMLTPMEWHGTGSAEGSVRTMSCSGLQYLTVKMLSRSQSIGLSWKNMRKNSTTHGRLYVLNSLPETHVVSHIQSFDQYRQGACKKF